MDWVRCRDTLPAFVRKYRIVCIAVLAGILMMTIPEAAPEAEPVPQTEAVRTPALEDSLAEILSGVSGAGRVRVLLTEAEGEYTFYQTDEAGNAGDIRRDTVLVTGADREERGLIRQVKPPVYRGAVILCQGAEDPQVKLSLVEAVKSVTGLTSDRITVLKMK